MRLSICLLLICFTSPIFGTDTTILFNQNSSADETGSGKIFYDTNGGRITFANNATASNANFNLGGLLEFFSHSTAANAQITITGANSILTFFNNSTGGCAHIISSDRGNVFFTNTSKAQSMQMDLSQSTLSFGGNSQANNAIINATNGSAIVLKDNATANQVQMNLAGSTLSFLNAATGSSASVQLASSEIQFNQNNTLGSLSADSASSIFLNSFDLIIGSNNSDMVIEGIISGLGSNLTKVGAGTLFLQGKNTFSGNTDINSGKLAGTGSVAGNLNINRDAIFAPGNNAIGTFTVEGNYTQNKRSTLQVAVNGDGQSSLVNVMGMARLKGALEIFSPDGLFVVGKDYLLVKCDQGSTGNFSSVTVSNPYFLPKVRYNENEVLLSLAPNFTGSAGKDSNLKEVAKQIDTLVNPNTEEHAFINDLAQKPLSHLRKTLSRLNGEQYLTILQISQKSNDQFLRRVQTFMPICCKDCKAYPEWWVQADGGAGNFRTSRKNFRTHNWNTYAGISLPACERLIVGAVANYEHNQIDFKKSGHGRANQGRFAIYGVFCDPRFYIALDAFGGYGNFRLRRDIHINIIRKKAKANLCFSSGTFYGEVGGNICCWENVIQPFFGWEASCFHRSRAKEQGAGLLNLRVKNQNYFVPSTRLGLHLANCTCCYGTRLSADIAWRHNFDYNRRGTTVRFSHFGHSFRVHNDVVSPNVLEYLVTLSKQWQDCFSVYLQFAGEYSNKYSDFEVGLGAYVLF